MVKVYQWVNNDGQVPAIVGSSLVVRAIVNMVIDANLGT